MTLIEIARADIRERTRRYGFLVTLVLTLAAGVFLLPAREAGYTTVNLGAWSGIYTARWIGVVMALHSAVFLSLAGFYVVRGSIARDRTTGVGAVLAATPLSSSTYLSGKALSNFFVLSLMTGAVAAAALVLQFVRGEDPVLDLVAILMPFLVVTLPVMAVTAAMAVLFEILPGFKGSGGNVAWFFFWVFVLINPFGINHVMKGNDAPFWLDPSGMALVAGHMVRDAMEVIPGYDGKSFSLGASATKPDHLFTWAGLAWTPGLVLGRMAWLGIAALIVTAAAPFFDRFNTAVRPARREGRGKKSRDVAPDPAIPQRPGMDVDAGGDQGDRAADRLPDERPSIDVTQLPAAFRNASPWNMLPLVAAELRLMIKGVGRFWLIAAAGLAVAGFAAPAGPGDLVRGLSLILPLPLLSALGCREALSGTTSLVFTAPRPVSRLLPAQFLAGFILMLLAVAGPGARFLVAGSIPGVVAWSAGAAFVSALALAAGVWTGNRRLFEALYLALWYIGPMQQVTPLDYMGVTSAAVAGHLWMVWAGLAAVLLAAAAAGRGRVSS